MASSHSIKLRLIALLVVATFCFQEIAWAAPQTALSAPVQAGIDPASVEVPFQFVTLKEFHKGTSGKLVIHIQDAHSNLSGQQNLANALERLMEEAGTPLVLVEGADRDVTLDEVRESVDPKEWRIAAKRFLYDGAISGEEYLNLTSDRPMRIIGVEQR